MKILVPSVKHSGATILVNQMMDSYEQLTLRNPGEGIVSDHVIYTKVDDLKHLASISDQIVIPIRHPKVVAKLWLDNGEEVSTDMIQMFHSIVEFAEFDNVTIIPMDCEDLKDRLSKIKDFVIKSEPRLSVSQKAEMELRAYNIKYEELLEVEGKVKTDRGIRAIRVEVGDKIQELVDDIRDFLDDAYGYDAEVKPERSVTEKKRKNQKPRAPKNSWKHICPKTQENAYVTKGEICPDCGGSE